MGAVQVGYFGSKATSGLCQPLIAMMPPHATYIETHLGGGAIMRRKAPALRNIGIDRDARALDAFECDYPVERIHGCAHRFVAEYAFEGSELIYSDPPYLKRTRSSRRRYRFDYEEADHIELLERLKGVPGQVMVSGYPSVLYDERLEGWGSVELQVMNQGGVRTEKLWFNFVPDRVHWARYAGKNFTDRQRIKRKAHNWGRRYEALCAEGKMSVDSRALVDALLMLFEVLIAVFMEKHTPKSSINSSLPASRSPHDETALTRPGAKGKGPSLNHERCANTRTRESVRVLSVDACERCGEDLSDAACLGHERRTLIDIVFEKVVRHADAQIKHCPRCHTDTRARFPAQMPGPLQYGHGIKAYVVHLLVAQMLSLKRAAQSVHTLIGQAISEATLLNYIIQLHRALADWESRAIERLLTMPAMHVDETSLRVDRKNHWIHVYSAGDITLKCLHPKRGCEAIEAIGIIPRYGGVAVHDCWASYLSYTHCAHALCGAHLVRELTFIVDAHGYAWARRMKRLLLSACHQVRERDDKTLAPSQYTAVQKRYRTILTQGARELPPIPPRSNGQRGRVAKSDAHNLWERLRKHETAVLLFAKHPDVAFTNNRAERDLPMSKVKQKVSGCFRTRRYAKAYCRISSYLQSMANQGHNPLVAIQIALAGRAVDNLGE